MKFKILLHFFLSFLLFLPWFILLVISLPTVAILLLTKWSGGTTWFGNYLYPRGVGNVHMPTNPTYFEQWWFLCIRNPVSNFGKKVLSVPESRAWPWLYDIQILNKFYMMFGWKNPVNGFRTFVFRPWIK